MLLLDKPVGLSSNAALLRAKRLFRAEKAGHTGTLDPLASGLLPLCFGEATKYAQSLLDADKRYTATVRFGSTTATGDAEGPVVATHAVSFDQSDLESALRAFTGRVRQTPPAYSALKYQGRAYYEYARSGVDIPRVPRQVEITALTLLAWDGVDALLDVQCSKGTYIRVLAEDIGHALQCGAHLAALRRTATGGFDVANTVTLTALQASDEATLDAMLLPVDAPIAGMPRLDVDAAAATALRRGRAVARDEILDGRFRCYTGSEFIGMVEAAEGCLRPMRLVRTN